MKRFIPFFIAIFTALTACTEYHDFERRLSVADTLMNEQPDSAYRMLCAMNEEANHLPEALRMHHLLLRSNAQNKADVLFTSDSIGNVLVDYYNQYGTPNERMLAHYIKGCAYRDMGDQPAALRCYNDAVAAADTFMTDCNYDQLSIIYGQIATIFDNRTMPDNALEAYEMAERYAWKAKDTINVLTIWSNKSNALIDKGKINEGLCIKINAAKKFEEMGYPQKAARTLGPCIKWHARQGNFDKAKAAMDNYESLSGYFQANGNVKNGREDYYHIKGSYYLEKEQLDSAEHFFRKLQLNGQTRNDLYLATWGLTRLFTAKSHNDSIAKYALQTLAHSDTLYNITAAKNLQNAQALYNYARHQENALRKELETQKTQLRLYKWIAGSIIIAVLLTLFILFLRRQNRQKQHELTLATQENDQLHTQIQENAETIEGLNQLVDTNKQEMHLLNEQISEKSHLIEELNRIINKNAADLQQNQQLKESVAILQAQVETHKQEIQQLKSAHKQGRLQDEPAIACLMHAAKKQPERPNAAQWRNIIALVESYYPGMLTLKQQFGITHAEYRLCILLKAGIELADIIYIEDTYHANITTMRRRMLKKLGKEGGAKEFDHFIASL